MKRRSAIAHGGSAVGADGHAAARPQGPAPLIEAPESESEFADLIAEADALVGMYGLAKEWEIIVPPGRCTKPRPHEGPCAHNPRHAMAGELACWRHVAPALPPAREGKGRGGVK